MRDQEFLLVVEGGYGESWLDMGITFFVSIEHLTMGFLSQVLALERQEGCHAVLGAPFYRVSRVLLTLPTWVAPSAHVARGWSNFVVLCHCSGVDKSLFRLAAYQYQSHAMCQGCLCHHL